MEKPVLLLRLSYWIAAIADFGVAVLVLIPERMGVSEFVYPMGLASAPIFSWAVLLLVADRKPMERRWMLIPTIMVIALLAFIRVVFAINGDVEFSMAILLFAIALISFIAYSYYCASKYTAENPVLNKE